MVNINVLSRSHVEIENEKFDVNSKQDLIELIKAILDKAYFSGETTCLEEVTIVNELYQYREIERWK